MNLIIFWLVRYTVLDPGDVPPAITTSATTVISATTITPTTESDFPTTATTDIETSTTTETSIASATSAAAVSSATTKSSPSVGLVVGSIVVPVVIAVFVAFLLCRRYRRKRQTQQAKAGYYNETSLPVVQPVQPSWTPQDSSTIILSFLED
jgi:hypothetical protein